MNHQKSKNGKRIIGVELYNVIGTFFRTIIAVFFLTGILSISLLQADNKVGEHGKRVTTDKIFTCKSVPKGIETTTVTLYLQQFSLPRNWSDPGNSYEIQPIAGFEVYLDEKSKKTICEGSTYWKKRDYRKPTIRYEWNNFSLDYKLIVHNVPLNGKVNFNISLREADLGQYNYQYLILYGEPKVSSPQILDIFAYPAKKIAYIEKELNDSKHLIYFGKSKRTVGVTKVSDDNVLGRLDFTITQNKEIKVSGAKINKPKLCSEYADTAVNLNYEAQKYQCGFKPPIWSGNKKGHIDWCMHGNNYREVSKVNADRVSAFNTCKKQYLIGLMKPSVAIMTPAATKMTKEQICNQYSLDAVTLNHEAQKHHCGFKFPVWSNDYQKHFDWCMHGDNRKYAVNENKKRKASLQTCKGKSANKPSAQPAVQYCKIYAQDAINQYNASQQRGCGFFGLGWSLDYNTHLNWCIDTYKKGNLTVIVNETARRNAMLSNCK